MLNINLDWRLLMNINISSIIIIDSKKEVHTIAKDSKVEVEIIDITAQQHKPKGRNSVYFQKPETTITIKNAEAQKAINPFASKGKDIPRFSIRLSNTNKIYELINATVLKEDDSTITVYAPSKIRMRRNNG